MLLMLHAAAAMLRDAARCREMLLRHTCSRLLTACALLMPRSVRRAGRVGNGRPPAGRVRPSPPPRPELGPCAPALLSWSSPRAPRSVTCVCCRASAPASTGGRAAAGEGGDRSAGAGAGVGAGGSGAGGGSGLRVAVGIVGRLPAFSFESFAPNVVRPNVEVRPPPFSPPPPLPPAVVAPSPYARRTHPRWCLRLQQ
jgi:hypothetical protein